MARVHTYTVELGRDGVVRTRRESHGLEHVLGGPLPAGAVPEAVWESCVDEADLPAYREHRSALRAGRPGELELTMHRFDGEERRFLLRERPRRSRRGLLLIDGSVADVTQRFRAERAAADAHERLAAVFGGVSAYIYSYRLHPDLRVDSTSADDGSLRRLLGVEPDAPFDPAIAWDEAIHPEDRDAYVDALRGLLAGRAADIELRVRRADGAERWVWMRDMPRRTAIGVQVEGITLDVTGRREVEDALADARAELGRLAATIEDVLYTARIDADGEERLLYLSRSRDALLGGQPRVAGAGAWEAAIHPDDLERWRAARAALHVDARALDLEYRVLGVDGRQRWVWERARVRQAGRDAILLDGTLSDVTARRGAEERLEQALQSAEGANRRLREMMERIAGVGAAIDDVLYAYELHEDGSITTLWESGKSAALLGLPVGALPLAEIDRLWVRSIHADDEPRYRAAMRRLRDGVPLDLEVRLVGVDGVVRDLWMRDVPRVTPDGRVLVEGVSSDVSARKAEAAALAERTRQLDLVASSANIALFTNAYGADGSTVPVWSSRDLTELLGHDPEAVGEGVAYAIWHDAILPDDLPRLEAMRREVAAGSPARSEVRLRAADGGLRWFDVHIEPRDELDAQGRRLGDGVLVDTTVHRAVERELEDRDRGLDALGGAIGIALFTLGIGEDGAFEPLWVSRDPLTLVGVRADTVSPAETLSRWCAGIAAEDAPEIARMQRDLLAGEPASCEHRVLDAHGRTRWFEVRILPRQVDGRAVGDGVILDVTERKENELRLDSALRDVQRRVGVDDLTGVLNRAEGARRLSAALGAMVDGAPVGLLLLDIDLFKSVNDDHGHLAGDDVLVEVARRLAACVRPSDAVVRWGGEEFAVILPGTTDPEGLRIVAERMRCAIDATRVRTRVGDLAISISVGAASTAEAGRATFEALVDAADTALYVAKRRGRNQTRVHALLTERDGEEAQPRVVRLAEVLAIVAGARESMPHGHAMQVADLAARTATALGLPPATVHRCRLGGWLHDIGKVTIADAVLEKPGELDEAEWEQMRNHAEIGAAMLAQVPELVDAAAAVRHHHERWDGRGYPVGLARDAIPVESRVIAAADAFTAMTTDRLHRRALDFDDALGELERAAGTQLDPAVVDALVRLLREPRRIPFRDADAA